MNPDKMTVEKAIKEKEEEVLEFINLELEKIGFRIL